MSFKLDARRGWGGARDEWAPLFLLDKTSALGALNSQALQTQWFERLRAFESTGVVRERIWDVVAGSQNVHSPQTEMCQMDIWRP